MEYHRLGTSDMKISSIILGTWQAGKAMWTGIDDNETTKAIQTAYDKGITTFDTAEVYGNGHSERILGKALKGHRKNVILMTKVFSNHLKHTQLIKSCERSLKNLNTDYIDLYQIHWPPGSFGQPVVSLEETFAAMNELKKQGKIRAIGVSNFSEKQLSDASKYGRIESLQPPYSLFWRYVETDAMPYCLNNNITILAYSSMAQGLLTGKFDVSHQFEKGDNRSQNILFQRDNLQRAHKVLNQLRPIADKYQISLGQLALAWVISHPNTSAIAGARNSQQVEENAMAGSIRISDKDLAQINDIGRIVTDHLGEHSLMWTW